MALLNGPLGDPLKSKNKKVSQLYSDVSTLLLPENHKDLLKWCKMFYKLDDKVSDVVYKLAEYAATRITVETDDTKLKEQYKNILKNMKIDDKIIEMGLTYFVYADVVISAVVPIKRIFSCKKCGTIVEPSGDLNKFDYSSLIPSANLASGTPANKKKANWTIKDNKLYVYCPKCKAMEEVEIEDVVDTESVPAIKIYDPLYLEIEYNPLNEKREFIYTIPSQTIKKIQTKASYLKTTTLESLKAVLQGYKKIKFYNDKIIHISRPTIADDDDPWSIPPILHVFKLLIYLQSLRRATEFTALDNLNRYRYLTVQPNAMGAASLSYKKLKKTVNTAIKQWENDPSYIPLFPEPVVYQGIGGEGRPLLLTQEMAAISDAIINGLQVPKEFVYGGLTWTGSSISLRMLENHFINYRNKIQQFLDYLSVLISRLYDIPKADLKLQPFKMADDIQRKQILMNLNQEGKVSDHTMLNDLDLDADHEFELSKQETYQQQVALSIIQSKVQLLQTLLQAKAGEQMQQPNLDLNGATMDEELLKNVLTTTDAAELVKSKPFQEFLAYVNQASPEEQQQILSQLSNIDSLYTQLFNALQNQTPSVGQLAAEGAGALPPDSGSATGSTQSVSPTAPEQKAPTSNQYGV